MPKFNGAALERFREAASRLAEAGASRRSRSHYSREPSCADQCSRILAEIAALPLGVDEARQGLFRDGRQRCALAAFARCGLDATMTPGAAALRSKFAKIFAKASPWDDPALFEALADRARHAQGAVPALLDCALLRESPASWLLGPLPDRLADAVALAQLRRASENPEGHFHLALENAHLRFGDRWPGQFALPGEAESLLFRGAAALSRTPTPEFAEIFLRSADALSESLLAAGTPLRTPGIPAPAPEWMRPAVELWEIRAAVASAPAARTSRSAL